MNLYNDSYVHAIGSFPLVRQGAIDFLSENSKHLLYNQLSLWTVPQLKNANLSTQLQSGCGSLKKLNSPYEDQDFSVPSTGTEWLTPLVDFVEKKTLWTDHTAKVCRPMIRILEPKTCLSYHRDFSPLRIHLVLSTNVNSMFVVNHEVHQMGNEGWLYTLRTDLLHTAINADYEKQRIHLTFSVIPKPIFKGSS